MFGNIIAHIIFAALTATTPHCHPNHHNQVTNCHYSDSVSVSTPAGQMFAEVHNGIYTISVYPR